MNTQKQRALVFLKLSINYLRLVENVANELIKQGNKNIVISKHPLTQQDIEEKTKWNDYKIVEPFFFSFYHSLELLLKGFLLSQNGDVIKHSHRIEKLFEEFCKYFPNQNNLILILSKYIGSFKNIVEPLNTFFIHNKITVDKFYEAFKYPESRDSFIEYDYDSLKYQDIGVIEFYRQLSKDILAIMVDTVTYGRNYLE
jgi:hypothetical protein